MNNSSANESKGTWWKRNLTFFKYALLFAYNQNSLTANDIFDFLENINNSKNVGLDNKELLSISTSVFKRWQNGTIVQKTDELGHQ